MTTPNRRWFQFSLKRLLLWDVPFAGLLAWSRPWRLIQLLGWVQLVELAVIFGLAWLFIPIYSEGALLGWKERQRKDV